MLEKHNKIRMYLSLLEQWLSCRKINWVCSQQVAWHERSWEGCLQPIAILMALAYVRRDCHAVASGVQWRIPVFKGENLFFVSLRSKILVLFYDM